MLKPTKHTDPNRSLLVITAVMLDRLRRRRLIPFDDLRDDLRAKHTGVDRLFVPALNLLHMLGLIQYHMKIDSFEYVGPS